MAFREECAGLGLPVMRRSSSNTQVIDDSHEKAARFLTSTLRLSDSVAVTGDVENATLPGGS